MRAAVSTHARPDRLLASLGSGKTTLRTRILNGQQCVRAALVND